MSLMPCQGEAFVRPLFHRRLKRCLSDRHVANSANHPSNVLREWIASIGSDPHLGGTRSLRRTKATLINRRTGNLRAVQLLLGHTKNREHRPISRH